MRHKTLALILALLLLLASASPVIAAGDKERGAVGLGTVAQHHESWCGYECRP